ncbi:MAG: dihydrodipicolinate reductase [Acidobacteria bacterium]|nr:dihydrodipicolinate reductase [Acidobacteriota bacterium]
MRITLIGYGKMGRMIEEIGRGMGHEIIHTIDIDDSPGEAGFSGNWVENSDVVIDFSVAEAVVSNIRNAVAAGLPIVEGTTGWNGQLETVRQIVEDAKGACVYSSNYSMGVLALFHLTRQAGKLLSRWKAYRPFIHEAHHDQKVDAPSGTALSLKEILEESYSSEIPTSSTRAGFIPGVHVVGFDSPFDTLTLEHRARSREGFSRGAIFAAEWVQGKSGFYNFEEVLFGDDR